MADADKQLVLRFIDEVANRADLDLVDDLVHRDFFSHEAAAGHAAGPAGVKQAIRGLHDAFAGFRVEYRDVLAESGRVAVRARVSGRHVSQYGGFAPSGREWSTQQIHIVRIVDAKLIEHWASRDDLGALRQLGLLPSPRAVHPAGSPASAADYQRRHAHAPSQAHEPSQPAPEPT
jgi:predicted ester cyclase